MPSFQKDRTGVKLGLLTVVKHDGWYVSPKGKREATWECACECGGKTSLVGSQIGRGDAYSCGCVRANKHAPGDANFRQAWLTYRASARARNLFFTLTLEQFKSIVVSDCHYCGAAPSRTVKTSKHCAEKWREASKITIAGIDRQDNAKGYEISNCVPCCKTCNFAKHSQTSQEFEAWIAQLVRFRTKAC